MNEFSHLDETGKPKMVDVSEKNISLRTATARSIVSLPVDVLNKLESDQFQTKKGSVFQTAVIAGIMAAKKTGSLIPLCHPLAIENCEIDIHVNNQREIVIECSAGIRARTGVEMEALVGATIAALTVYDMCKSMSHDIKIRETELIEKKGGKNDFRRT